MKHDIYKLAEQYHLNESEQQMFQSLLEAADQNIQYSVREFAARNYVSPAALIRLSKKMGYTGYTDMVYRLGFLVQNEINNKNHESDITAFIGDRYRILCPLKGFFCAQASGYGLLCHWIE